MALWQAAKATISTLRELGMEDTCLIGGVAAKLYGSDREPHDVDVLILNSQYGQEEIKRMITRKNPCFYLVDAKTTAADWKVLWNHPRGEGSTKRSAAIKIDILLPGIMELPSFNPYWINYHNSLKLPTAPLLLVLLHKVRGWSKRVNSADHHYEKHRQDASDVATLAPLASQMGVTIHDNVLSDEFIESASVWVNDFIAAYPNLRTQYHWRKIGFTHMPETHYLALAIT